MTQKCVICNRRPARTDKGYCLHCAAQLEVEGKSREVQKVARFLTYRGIVVGLYPNGNGKLKAQLLRRSPEGLPKSLTLDLNTYLEGFTREQVKAFNRCVLSLANGQGI